MKNIKRISIAAALAAPAFFLAACGGGGGGSTPSNASTSTTTTPPASSNTASTLQTAVAAPTYANGTLQASAFSTLNAFRLAMGVGQIAQNAVLDTAAQAHATYLNTNLANGSLTALSHDEVSTYANFYADTPLDRARKAGAPATEWIGEDVADSALTDPAAAGTDCVNRLFATVYHLASLTSPQQTIGIGFTPVSGQLAYDVCTFDFGSSTNVYGTPTANAIPSYGGQQMASTAIAHAPLSNQTNVALTMTQESPNPASDIATPGHPLLVRVRADQSGDVLTVSGFTLTNASGASVAGRILIPAAAQSGSTASAVSDANGLLGAGIVVFLPSQPLAANTVYTATFSGARDGTPVSATWSFTTGAN